MKQATLRSRDTLHYLALFSKVKLLIGAKKSALIFSILLNTSYGAVYKRISGNKKCSKEGNRTENIALGNGWNTQGNSLGPQISQFKPLSTNPRSLSWQERPLGR